MSGANIFVSVGQTADQDREKFVCALEERLRTEGLVPKTVGRNTFSSNAPLKAAVKLLDDCSGSIVIALQRSSFPTGIERRCGRELILRHVILPTPWNQIEAAMTYVKNLPLLIIVEEGMKQEGLLEKGNDWFVLTVPATPESLQSVEFNGVLAHWKSKVNEQSMGSAAQGTSLVEADITVSRLFASLKLSQLWALFGAVAAALGGAFVLGAKFAAVIHPK